MQFLLEKEKIQPPRQWAQFSISRGRLGILVLDRRTITLVKNKMYSKFIKSHQCSLERYHAVFWLKLILNSDQDLALSWQKQILTGLLVTKIYKNRTMKISLFDYSMLRYILPITTSLFHKFSFNPYRETHTPDWTSSIIPPRDISDKFTIIWDSNLLYDILQEPRFSHCQP